MSIVMFFIRLVSGAVLIPLMLVLGIIFILIAGISWVITGNPTKATLDFKKWK